MAKIFEKVVELDKMINEAFENDDIEREERLYDEQCELMDKIEKGGMREEFDRFIESM